MGDVEDVKRAVREELKSRSRTDVAVGDGTEDFDTGTFKIWLLDKNNTNRKTLLEITNVTWDDYHEACATPDPQTRAKWGCSFDKALEQLDSHPPQPGAPVVEQDS